MGIRKRIYDKIEMKYVFNMKTTKLFVMVFALLALSQFAVAQVTTAQIREQIALYYT